MAPTVGEGTPLWVTTPLRFRSEPRVAPETWIDGIIFTPGMRLVSTGPERDPDARGISWLPVLTPDGRAGWIASRLESVPSITRNPPERQAFVVSPIGLRLRSAPRVGDDTWIEHIVLAAGTRLVAIDIATPPDADGRTWQQVRTGDGRAGWVAASQGPDVLLSDEPPAPPAPPWPFGKALAGLHGPADPFPLIDPDYNCVRTAGVEAVKLLTAGDGAPGHGAVSVRTLLEIRSDMFLVARMFEKPGVRHMSPQQFVDATVASVRELHGAGVRYFEVHNEPNLSLDGLGVSWRNGSEFNDWFLQVLALLRADPALPDARYGFPGCSPGPAFDMRQAIWDAPSFLEQCDAAIRASDWVGVHCYWQNEEGMHSLEDGMGWKKYRERWPGKLLIITEFSNNSGAVSPADKGRQYVQYYQLLRHEAAVGAAFSYVLFWQPEADANHESWRGKKGALTDIPGIVGHAVPELG